MPPHGFKRASLIECQRRDPRDPPRVTLPGSLHTLTFGERFKQSLVGVALPRNLQALVTKRRAHSDVEF